MKRTALVITAAIAVAALAVSALAAPVAYHPALADSAPVAAKVSGSDSAGFAGSAAKRVARVARKHSAKRAARTRTTAAPAPTTDPAPVAPTVVLTEAERAQAILATLAAKYPLLAGTTVEIGDAQGYQAVAYYRSGRIIISPTHTATLERILNHEVWHVIDYRDNGTINWGENLPPANASSYAAY